MINRRTFVASATASLLATPALASTRLPRKFRPQEVDVNPELPAGQIHVIKENFHLYWTLGDGRARRYGIALGAQGRNYTGVLTIRRKAEWPSWVPTQNMINLEPDLYGVISIGRRNTLIFLERWSVYHEVSATNVLYRDAEVGDVGSMAAWRVFELDWAQV